MDFKIGSSIIIIVVVILRILFNKQFEKLRNDYSSEGKRLKKRKWHIAIVVFDIIFFILCPIYALISDRSAINELAFNTSLLIAGCVIVFYEMKYIK